jgi:exonuclease SbcC
LEDWISKQFVPVISFVERNVLVKLKSEFSKLFSEWFSMLVSDSFNVYLNDDFTPIIEQQDYELDYNYLSGGERTAIALAYRLALNQVINSLLSKIKTKDLVILDEPTDGFSSAQLDKMREVLDELNVAQLIIVSHEQKIEGFVDNVIRLKKENGVSFIEK